MTTERWAFCKSELADPAKCNGRDELTATVPDPDNPGETLECGVIIYRNGEVSNRWDDGTVGVPADVTELADKEETLYHQERDEYADVWADVLVDHNGAWLGWAGAAPKMRVQPMFREIFQGEHGPTVTAANPKLDAYKQAAYVQNTLGRHYRLTCHVDGAYTVAGDGLDPLTFQPE